MYAGYGAFMLRDLPFDAIEFMAYEQVSTTTVPCFRRQGVTHIAAMRHVFHASSVLFVSIAVV